MNRHSRHGFGVASPFDCGEVDSFTTEVWTARFESILSSSGVEVLPTAYPAPNMNAYAERFIQSIKSECIGQMIFPGQRSLDHATNEFVEHYHDERSHQGLETGSSAERSRNPRALSRSCSDSAERSITVTGGRHERRSSFRTLRQRRRRAILHHQTPILTLSTHHRYFREAT